MSKNILERLSGVGSMLDNIILKGGDLRVERDNAVSRITELEAQLSAVQKDAARYQWLCGGAIFGIEGISFESLPSKYEIVWKDVPKGTIDTAIDKAIAGEKT